MDTGGKIHDIFMAVIPFVMARCKATGGFSATPMLPATIEDTYHALNILNLARKYNAACNLESDTFRESILRSYLSACRLSLLAGSRTTFQLLWCCRIAGLELNRGAIEAAVIARMKACDSLEVWYYSARILAEVLDRKPLIIPETGNLAAVLDPFWRCVDEAWMHLYLSREFRDAFPRPMSELIAWFRACQNGDGGFGFFPGTTSFVENCHASLLALALLGVEPLHPNRAFRFISCCQAASGGFGRSSRAASYLDATWHPLAALAFIA